MLFVYDILLQSINRECNMKSDISVVFEVLFTLRMFVCNKKSRHHLPKRVWQSLWRLDSPGFHTYPHHVRYKFLESGHHPSQCVRLDYM